MKFYQQEGSDFKRTHMAESGRICDCCEDYLHASEELHDDVECKQCGKLCCCECHREVKS